MCYVLFHITYTHTHLISNSSFVRWFSRWRRSKRIYVDNLLSICDFNIQHVAMAKENDDIYDARWRTRKKKYNMLIATLFICAVSQWAQKRLKIHKYWWKLIQFLCSFRSGCDFLTPETPCMCVLLLDCIKNGLLAKDRFVVIVIASWHQRTTHKIHNK